MTEGPATVPAHASSFPRQHARTRRFTLGIPRSFTVAPDGSRVLFLRARSGHDPVTSLWCREGDQPPRLLVDADVLEAPADLPAAERARRERVREMAAGITAYAADRALGLVAFTLAGQVHTVDVDRGRLVAHPAEDAFDPRPDPTGRRVAYGAGDALHLLDLVGGREAPGASRLLAVEDGIAWGRAEFIAAEEMGRTRGFWWSPAGDQLAVTRVDESPVPQWHISDPATPWQPPQPHRYPAAGNANAEVRLAVLAVEGGRRVDVAWDRDTYPYLAHVAWEDGPLTLLVQTRDQRRVAVLTVDPDSGATTERAGWGDDAWVELIPGTPAWDGDRLVTVRDLADHGPVGSRALVVDDEVCTAPGLQVRQVHAVADRQAVVSVSHDDPTQVHVGVVDLDRGSFTPWTHTPGVHGYTGGTRVGALVTQTLDDPRVAVEVGDARGDRTPLEVVAEAPVVTPRPRLLELGERGLRAALLCPADGPEGPLPVLLDPYGGPHAQRVVAAARAYTTSQWLADQGFAVLVVDGRGTPGRGPRWERSVRGDLAGPVLADQIDALRAAAEVEPRLDLTRVAIRGWSFGGYLAALAVLRRPDVFRAGIAGAPVTDWRLYDTHYTERYLGHPDEEPEAYTRSSLVDPDGRLLGHRTGDPARPPQLLIVHGLADDNVVAAHALRLSAALLAHGVPHRFLPLSGVTHMTPQETVAENLLRLQVAFLQEALGVPDPGGQRS